jgi:hypothetical protein
MNMTVPEARGDGESRAVENFGAGRNCNFSLRANRNDPVTSNNYDAVLDRPLRRTGQNRATNLSVRLNPLSCSLMGLRFPPVDAHRTYDLGISFSTI